MTDPSLRWAALADELQFNQLPAVRKQAETWRTGLAGLTSLLGAVLIVKGRDTVADLAVAWKMLVFALLLVSLILLVCATLAALYAASGEPGDTCLLAGEDLRRWTEQEVEKVQRAIHHARLLTLTGIGVLGVALAIAWLSPAPTKVPLFLVETGGGTVCGSLGPSGQGLLTVVAKRASSTTTMPLSAVTRISATSDCR